VAVPTNERPPFFKGVCEAESWASSTAALDQYGGPCLISRLMQRYSYSTSRSLFDDSAANPVSKLGEERSALRRKPRYGHSGEH
jgi:hypothetical protein